MKIYHIAGKEYAVSGDNLYERVPEAYQEIGTFTEGKDLVAGTMIAHETFPSSLPLRKKPLSKAKKVKPQKKPKAGHKAQTHCKNCDGYGHFAKTCPKLRNPEREAVKERILAKAGKINRCGNCGKPGHKATTCPDKKAPALTEDQIEYIREQSDAGVSVEKIAMDTGLDEAVIKKYW